MPDVSPTQTAPTQTAPTQTADPGEGAGAAGTEDPHRASEAGVTSTDYPGQATDATGEAFPRRPDGTSTAEPAQVAEPTPDSATAGGQHGGEPSLVKEAPALRLRWESVQISFVDDPRQAVSDAEALVNDVLDDMTAGFRQQRQDLESLWSQGHEVSTEQLRQAIQRYHQFFERFLRV